MLHDMAYCPSASRVAVGGGSTVKLLDVGAEYGEVSQATVELPAGHTVNKLGWGQDGQVGQPPQARQFSVAFRACTESPPLYRLHMTASAEAAMLAVDDNAWLNSIDTFVACNPSLLSCAVSCLQLLTVGTVNGLLITYLASLPAVFAAGGTKHAMLTSLGEITVHDVISHSSTAVLVQCEPSICSVGPRHLAVGVNNQVLFHTHSCSPGQLVSRRSYLGGVQAVCLNDTHAAVLTDGRVVVHAIESSSLPGQEPESGADLCLPQPGAARTEAITCVALSQHFLATATASGAVCHYVVQDGALAVVNEHRHTGRVCRQWLCSLPLHVSAAHDTIQPWHIELLLELAEPCLSRPPMPEI